MVGNGKAPTDGSGLGLVGLVAHSDWLYAFGDPKREPVDAQPIARPRILHSLFFMLPYDALTLALERLDSKPTDANAFVLGRPVVGSVLDLAFDAGLQYYRLDLQSWQRAQSIKPTRAPLLRYLAECDAGDV